MNLSFNIAIHVLTFLTKHSNERFSSDALAEKVFVNAVQLRNVARILKQHDYLDVHRGQAGGYQATKKTASANLGDLYLLFTEGRDKGRIFTGDHDSSCEVSSQISTTMAKHFQQEAIRVQAYYENFTIKDILEDILKEDK